MQPLRPLDFSDDDDAPEVRERPDLLDKIHARLLRLSNDELRLVADAVPDGLEVMKSLDKLVQLVKTNIDQVGAAAPDELRSKLVQAMRSYESLVGRLLRKQMGIGDELSNWLSLLKNKADSRVVKVDHVATPYTSHGNRNGDVHAGWEVYQPSGVIPSVGVVAGELRSGTIGGQAQGPRVVLGNMHRPEDGMQFMLSIDPELIGYGAYVQGNLPSEVLHYSQQQADQARLENDANAPAPGEFTAADMAARAASIGEDYEDDDDD